MDKQQIEQEMFVTIQGIDECRRAIAMHEENMKKLQAKLEKPSSRYLKPSQSQKTVLFAFNGKNRDLPADLQSEIQKAQN